VVAAASFDVDGDVAVAVDANVDFGATVDDPPRTKADGDDDDDDDDDNG